MSTAAVTDIQAGPGKQGGRKKLFILIGAVVLVLGLAGAGGAYYVMKQRAAQAEAEGDGEADTHSHAKPAKRDAKAVPTFAALEPFTVNLADPKADRFAQVSVSLELSDAGTADTVKAFMPVIRNNVLIVISQKTSAELLDRDGKVRLAREIHVETLKALGVEVPDELLEALAPPEAAASAAEPAPKKAAPKKSKKKAPVTGLPIVAVHFSNFIIQ